ncbi:hypothetical protein AAX26_01773 [Aliarcobacter thereius]|nr:hypothetical protein AAX26_01773 [Aliarcobacter thereius]
MNFGQKLKLKKDWEYNDIVTFDKAFEFFSLDKVQR